MKDFIRTRDEMIDRIDQLMRERDAMRRMLKRIYDASDLCPECGHHKWPKAGPAHFADCQLQALLERRLHGIQPTRPDDQTAS